MAYRMEPALSAEEWVQRAAGGEVSHLVTVSADEKRAARIELGPRKHALIAIINDSLPHSDPRKLTDRHVATLRDAARIAEAEGNTFDDLLTLADLIESYLPPAEDGDED